MKRLAASRSTVEALQQVREHPSKRVVERRSRSFVPGSAFSFALHGSLSSLSQRSDSVTTWKLSSS